MRVLIAGASGFLGSALAARLEAEGRSVVRLGRGPAKPGWASWDPSQGRLDPAALSGVTAVVNLAGESIAGGPWTTARRRRIRGSRVLGTGLLARAVAERRGQVEAFISASAVGYYGDRGEEELSESSDRGRGFLAEVAGDWEAAARPAAEAGVRVVHPRFGVLLHPSGGMLQPLLPVFRLGLGAQLGGGRQWLSWITRDDAVDLLVRLLYHPTLAGPVNAVTPHPVRNAEFTSTLGKVLGRPTFLRAPAWTLRLVLGELADDLLLASQRCVPAKLAEAEHRFAHPELGAALEAMIHPGDGPSTS